MDLNKIQSLLNDNFDIPDNDLDENDLENELEAILSGKPVPKATGRSTSANSASEQHQRTKPNRKAPTVPPNKNVYKNVGPVPKNNLSNDLDISNIEKMITTFDINDGSDDENIDENDENLLSELSNIVNNSSKSKKMPQHPSSDVFSISQKNIEPIPSHSSKHISDVQPPTRPVKSAKLDEQTVLEPVQNLSKDSCDKSQQIAQVKKLQIEYKRAALKAKTSGDKASALSHLKVSKQLDSIINQLNSNEDVDMSSLPPMPSDIAPSNTSVESTSKASEEYFEPPEMNQEEASKIYHAPTSVGSTLEALEQRLAKFKSTQEQATAEQNSSKARRLGRIVKQYETAIKDFKKGKAIDYDSLPCPPGFPPIPTASTTESTVSQSTKPSQPEPPKPGPSGKPQPSANNAAPTKPQRPPMKRALSTTANKQLTYLLERQKLFREAALEAKKRGELEQAKEYLRCAKGFDPLIEATKNGLPINATSIPTPPQLNNEDFVMINESMIDKNKKEAVDPVRTTESSTFYTNDEREELFRTVEKELTDQIEMCNRNKEYFLKFGDIATSSKFEKYSNESRKDLNMLIIRWRNGDNVPSYRTVVRTFSIVVSNPEVGLNEVHVDILKAFDLPGKPEIDTYVKLEFPIPTEKPQIKKTKTIYNTTNPEYKETVKFEIDRKSRSLPRILKRHSLKLEIYSKGNFLRSDTLIGTILVKMNDFETKCTIHECYPLTQGRKVINGRLEVKAKIREPLLAKQIEEIKEKWIVFS